jgi:hypothetical protein
MDLDTAMQAYKTNYAQYKVTGNATYKTAYENAQKWITNYISEQQSLVDQNNEYISKFVQEYSRTNPELAELAVKMQRVRKEGPATEDSFYTNHKLHETTSVDLTPYYVKGGIVAGLVGILVVLSFF